MKTNGLDIRLFACCCICSLALPRGGFCEERWTWMTAPFEVLVREYNRVEEWGAAYDRAHPPSNNWGGGARTAILIVNAMGKRGDRAALPFLEEKSLSTNTCAFVRSRAALSYISLATAGECAVFLPEILKIDDEDKDLISWRFQVTPAALAKIDTGMSNHELSGGAAANLLAALLAHTYAVYSTGEADEIEAFLIKHCAGYPASRQRLRMWSYFLDRYKENEKIAAHYSPIKKSIEAIPPEKRVDLRARFPGLPPLPEEPEKAGLPVPRAWLGAVLGFLAAGAAAVLLSRGRKARGP